MRSKVANRILAEIPEDEKIFMNLYSSLIVRIAELMKEKDMTQKDLAEMMDKMPSEISKWLNGGHNFTLRSLARLQAELGEVLLEVPSSKTKSKNKSGNWVVYNNTKVTTEIRTRTIAKEAHYTPATKIYGDAI